MMPVGPRGLPLDEEDDEPEHLGISVHSTSFEWKKDGEILPEIAITLAEADENVLKEKKDLDSFMHIITHCKTCQHAFVHHIPLNMDKPLMHLFVQQILPEFIKPLLMRYRCKDHGNHGYVGYIVTGLCRVATKKKLNDGKAIKFKGPYNNYFQLLVNTEKAVHVRFKVGKNFKLGKMEMGNDCSMVGGLVNVFTVKEPDRHDIPMHG